MNAPSPTSQRLDGETIVKVALAERSYDIVIGAGALTTF